jgi:hypothetical protein
VTSWLPPGRGIGSSKMRDQSAMMQPRRTNVGAAMIAHGAKHLGLQISKDWIVVKQKVRDRPGHSPLKRRRLRPRINSRPRSIPG